MNKILCDTRNPEFTEDLAGWWNYIREFTPPDGDGLEEVYTENFSSERLYQRAQATLELLYPGTSYDDL